MTFQMIGHERPDEAVAVVVARMAAKHERPARSRTRLFHEMRMELGFEELAVLTC